MARSLRRPEVGSSPWGKALSREGGEQHPGSVGAGREGQFPRWLLDLFLSCVPGAGQGFAQMELPAGACACWSCRHCLGGSRHCSRTSVHCSEPVYIAPRALCVAPGALCIVLRLCTLLRGLCAWSQELCTWLRDCVQCPGALCIALGAMYTVLAALYTAPEASALLRGCVRCSGSSVHYPWGSTLLQSLWALFSCCVHRSRGSVRCCHLAATLRNCSCCLSCCPLPSSRTLPAAGRLITATSQPLSASPRWLLTACVSGHTSISQGQAAQHRWPSLRGHLAGPTRSLSPSRGAGTAPSTSSQGQAASLPAALTSPALPPAFSCCT